MNKVNINKLSLYRGHNLQICDGITLHVPTLSEICDYGEKKYYEMITTLCATGIDICWQLEEANIPFDKISDYELFWQLLCKNYTVNDTKIIFGDKLDFSKMVPYIDNNNKVILLQKIESSDMNIVITENEYLIIVGYLREIHNLKKDERVAGTNSCRRAFIEDAKMEFEAKQLECNTNTSALLPLISTMVNSPGFKRNDETVWDMNIYAFMDSVKRIQKIKNSDLLLQSGYSGFGVDLKKVSNDELNYMGELN